MRHYLLLLAVLLATSALSAQNKKIGRIEFNNEKNLFSSKSVENNNSKWNFSQEQTAQSLVVNQNFGVANTIATEPTIRLNGNISTWKNMTTGNYEVYRYTSEFSTLDNDLQVVNTFGFDFPENTGHVRFGLEHNGVYGSVYIHFFEGTVHPDNQRSQVWLFDITTGEILKKLEGTGVEMHNDKLLLYSTLKDITISILDSVTFDVEFSKVLEEELVVNYSGMGGVPFFVQEIDGEDHYVFSHFEKLFMDNGPTFLATPNNSLVVKVYNSEYQLVTAVNLPMEDRTYDTPYIYPLVTFGMFSDIEISKHEFNSDDKYEFIYGIDYQDSNFRTRDAFFYVVNEDGEILHTLDNPGSIFSYTEKIEGFDDQVLFLKDNTTMHIFNVQSWEMDLDLEPTLNGDLLMHHINRIKKGDNFEYLIGLREYVEDDNGDWFARVKSYTRDGVETGCISLMLPYASYENTFSPNIYDLELFENPHIFNSDDEIEYLYAVTAKDEDRDRDYVSVSIAQSGKAPLAVFRNEGNYSLSGTGLVHDYETGEPKWLWNTYYSHTGGSYSLFYLLPAMFTGINEIAVVSGSTILYDAKTQTVIGSEDVQKIEVFQLDGKKVFETSSNSISTSNWNKGIFIVKGITTKGEVLTQKVLVY